MRKFLFLLVTFFPIILHAEYVYLFDSTDGKHIYADPSSVRSVDNYGLTNDKEITLWVKLKQISKTKIPETQVQYLINCSTEEFGIVQSISYNKNGNPIKSWSREIFGTPRKNAPPNSIGNGIIKFACS